MLAHDGLALSYRDTGEGAPFVFQHGLGGDAAQPASQAPDGRRLLSLECRGHGATPVGPEEALCFSTFARDLEALMDAIGLGSVALGGISMGAGVALALGARRPERVGALVLVRPAWVDRGRPRHLDVFAEIARTLREHGAAAGREIFANESRAYREARTACPSVASSLLAQFDRPGARERVAVLERLPADRPIDVADAAGWSALRDVPTLVLATHGDPVHPFSTAAELTSRLPAATLGVVPSKDDGDVAHRHAVASAIGEFLGGVRSDVAP